MNARDVACPRIKCSAAQGAPCTQHAEGYGTYIVPPHPERYAAADALTEELLDA